MAHLTITPSSACLQNRRPRYTEYAAFFYHDVTAYFYHTGTITIEPRYFTSSPFSDTSRAMVRQARNVEVIIYWHDQGGYVPTQKQLEARWPFYMASEMKMIRTLNSEAECLKKLIVNVEVHDDKNISWDMRERRLAQLKEVKVGVTFAFVTTTKFCDWGYNTSMKVKECIKQLNAERA